MATDKRLLWLSHVNLVVMVVLTAIVGNIALAHSKMKMPAQALKTAQVAGTVTAVIATIIGCLLVALILKGVVRLTGETMSFKDAYVTYLISRYPVIFYSLVEVGYALVKKQLISTDFSNYANILMVIFSQAIMYVYLDGRLSKKQNLIVNIVFAILLSAGSIYQLVK